MVAAHQYPLLMIDPMKIREATQDYQFRLNHVGGEVSDHKITDTEYDSLKHGAPLIVHKRKDGEVYVVDGYHRLAFIKRLAAEGKAPAQIPAYVLEEEKGISVKDAKLIAASLNLRDEVARGTLNIGDAAAVVKELETPDANLHKDIIQPLPDIKAMPQAYELSSLSYHSLGLVSAGKVPVKSAEYVVQKIKDRARWDAIMDTVAVKFQQDYPNYVPDNTLATTLAPKANDNEKSFVEQERTRRANPALGLGA